MITKFKTILTSLALCATANIALAEDSTETTSPETTSPSENNEVETDESTLNEQLPWENVLAIYRYDNHHNGLGEANLNIGVFYDIFQRDSEDQWHCDFTSNSDIFTYYLYTSTDGTTQFNNTTGLANNIIYSYNPRYLAIPSTTPPDKEETHSSVYPATITNCLSIKNESANGALNGNAAQGNYTTMTKFIRGVNYRATITINESRDNADITFERLDWDNYVEGKPTRKYIYYDNSDTQWSNVYIYGITYYDPTDGSTYQAKASTYGFLKMQQIGNTDIYYADVTVPNESKAITNIIFADKNSTSSSTQSSLQFGCFNEALYNSQKIYDYASAYVPTPLITSRTAQKCTFQSAVSGLELYYRIVDKSELSQESNAAPALHANQLRTNISDLEGWTATGSDTFIADLGAISTEQAYCVKAVSGVDDGAESEQLNVERDNNTISNIDTIASDPTASQPEYYNLQGIRIDNPAAGTIIIEKQGNHCRKATIKP